MSAYCCKVWDGHLLFSLCDGVEKHVFHSGTRWLWMHIPGEVKSTLLKRGKQSKEVLDSLKKKHNNNNK